MLKPYEIVPGVGVPPIQFGMSPDEVRQVMGEPDRGSGPGGAPTPGAWTYHDGMLLVNTDDEDRVNFLEISRDTDIQATYKGVAVLEVPPRAAIEVVGERYDEFLCADFNADVGLTSCDGRHWDTIGVGAGDHYRTYWDQIRPKTP